MPALVVLPVTCETVELAAMMAKALTQPARKQSMLPPSTSQPKSLRASTPVGLGSFLGPNAM